MARAATKIAADGFVIRRLSDSIGYDPLTEEWHFRARKSSSSSSGSNRHSWDDEREAFEESLKARRATLVVTGGLEEAETRSISSTDDSTSSSKRSSASNRRRLSGNSEVCIAANDATVYIKWPFSFAMSEIKLECPSLVSKQEIVVSKEDEASLEEGSLARGSICDGLSIGLQECGEDPTHPGFPPVPVLPSWNGTRETVSGSLCLCTITILNANVYMDSEIVQNCVTDPILIPTSSQCNVGFYIRVLVQMTPDYLSLAIIITSGKHDRKLPWPFDRKVIFGAMNKDGNLNRERAFKCYGNGFKFKECLRRPESAENPPIGILHFLPKQALKNGYVRDNCLYIRCLILPKEIVLPAHPHFKLSLMQYSFVHSLNYANF